VCVAGPWEYVRLIALILGYVLNGRQAGPPKGPPSSKSKKKNINIESTSISRTWLKMFVLKLIWRNVLYFVNCLIVEATTFVKGILWVFLHQTDSLQNEQSLLFQSFEVSKQWKVLSFVKRCLSLVFHHSGKVTIWAKFGFSSFWNFKAFKSLHFCQKMCLVSFSPNRQLTKWTKFVFFSSFWNLKFQRFENLLLSKEMFE